MSRLKSSEEYSRTKAFKFFRWLGGSKDPYIDTVESRHPEEEKYTDEELEKIDEEKRLSREKAYDLGQNKYLRAFECAYKILAALFCVFFAFVLIYNVSYLPPSGAAERPVNNEVSERYIEKGLEETGAVNIVAGMILDYRAFDTLGESHVLFTATITVLILMRLDKKKDEKGDKADRASRYEPYDVILQVAAAVLVPVIMIFGIYVILNGHISPGGGFSGGAIIGAGLILYLNAFGFEKTERFFTEKLYKRVTFGSLAFYALAKCYSFFCGANHLESGISTGTPGAIISAGLILPLNIAVGLVVACTMYAFYAHFRKGGF
jgi:multicomponent Na+:H+ antiporter subunit B